jgi:hypothetical protein
MMQQHHDTSLSKAVHMRKYQHFRKKQTLKALYFPFVYVDSAMFDP